MAPAGMLRTYVVSAQPKAATANQRRSADDRGRGIRPPGDVASGDGYQAHEVTVKAWRSPRLESPEWCSALIPRPRGSEPRRSECGGTQTGETGEWTDS